MEKLTAGETNPVTVMKGSPRLPVTTRGGSKTIVLRSPHASSCRDLPLQPGFDAGCGECQKNGVWNPAVFISEWFS